MSGMFNEDFDPLRELEILSHNQKILIDRSREQERLITDITAHVVKLNETLQKILREQARINSQQAVMNLDLQRLHAVK